MADMVEILYGNNATPGQIRARFGTEYKQVEETVRAILEDVRQNGDAALFAYAKKFDHAELTSLLVSEQEIDEAVAAIDPAFYETLQQAAENIRDFHKRQVRQGFSVSERKGVLMGQRVLPLERVGLYVPGGTASYPSTVLMNAIPAKIAGVKEIALLRPRAGRAHRRAHTGRGPRSRSGAHIQNGRRAGHSGVRLRHWERQARG
jgi:histidinol dehydrogenase